MSEGDHGNHGFPTILPPGDYLIVRKGLRIVAGDAVHDFQVAVSPKGQSVRIYGYEDIPVTRIGGRR